MRHLKKMGKLRSSVQKDPLFYLCSTFLVLCAVLSLLFIITITVTITVTITITITITIAVTHHHYHHYLQTSLALRVLCIIFNFCKHAPLSMR
jgi:uncharacterized membrane protein YGL010W